MRKIAKPTTWNAPYPRLYEESRKLVYCTKCGRRLNYFYDDMGYVWCRCPMRDNFFSMFGAWEFHTSELIDSDYKPAMQYDPITGKKL